MSIYAKVDTSDNSVITYPYELSDFITENPNNKPVANLSLAYENTEDQLVNTNYSVVEITEVAQPDHTNKQNVEESDPALIDGVWTQVWNVVNKSASIIASIEEEEQAVKLSTALDKRWNRLSYSDWTQLADAPITAAQASDYAEWRQLLRDLPEDLNWPDTDFPADPHGLIITHKT